MSNQESKKFEKEFRHGKGIIPTPKDWIEHFWFAHRVKVIESMSGYIKDAESILFVGVGQGGALPSEGLGGKRVVGIDLNRKALDSSTSLCNALLADGTMLPFKDGSMDLVVCNMVLHHIVGQGGLDAAIEECFRVLSPGGRLLAFEPNFFHPSGLALTLLNKFHLYHAVGGGSNYEYALSPFRLGRIGRRNFKEVNIRLITLGHPRFPVFIQRLIFRIDKYFTRLYPLGFSFMLEAVK
jgi:SAM-dependent methyltransferase